MATIWLPVGPLVEAVQRAVNERRRCEEDGHVTGLQSFFRDLDPSGRFLRSYYRALGRGRITVFACDELCVRVLHLHPAEIYGPTWWQSFEGAA